MDAMNRYYDLLMEQMEAVRRTQREKISTVAQWLEESFPNGAWLYANACGCPVPKAWRTADVVQW